MNFFNDLVLSYLQQLQSGQAPTIWENAMSVQAQALRIAQRLFRYVSGNEIRR